jgi:hypothetical protein
MDGSWVEAYRQRAGERARQEREVAVSHALSAAEYALVREGVHVGRALAAAGLEFDPSTFVTMRVLETSVEEGVDPQEALRSVALRDLIARSAERCTSLLSVEPPPLTAG